MNDALSQAIIRLYEEERFYAELVLQMDRIINESIPTACVCVKDKVQLHVNPAFFASLSAPEQVAILKHECKHILNDHISRAKDLYPSIYENKKDQDIADVFIKSAKHQLINIAADCAINPGIPNIIESAMMPKKFDLPNGETMEYYIEHLKGNKKLEELTKFDEHALWSESEGNSEELKEKIRRAVNEAAKKTIAAGKMSLEDELLVNALNHKAKDWKSDLRRFVARTTNIILATSKKKRNRRYGVMYPGIIKEEKLSIGVAIDTSGSVSDETLCQFMAEIANIAKYATITVVEADSEIKNYYIFDPKKTYKIKGRGGTAYQPALDFFTKESDIDGMIYFGDMDCCEGTLTKPKYPVIWAIVGDKSPPVNWGSITKVEVIKK